MSIEIQKTDDEITVNSPYDQQFIKKARELGGSWDAPVWRFDARDEERVRDLCLSVYGVDGRESGATADIRIDLGEADYDLLVDGDRRMKLLGRQIAFRKSRDRQVITPENVVVVEGSFRDRGGSRKNPRIGKVSGVVLEVRDLPVSVAKQACEEIPGVEMVEDIDEMEIAREEFASAVKAARGSGLSFEQMAQIIKDNA